LLETLETLKGKFLLSSFRNQSLAQFTKRNGWHTLEFRMTGSMTNRYKLKVEVMTVNYPITQDMLKDIKEPEPTE
jgi:DNA adenine methylase